MSNLMPGRVISGDTPLPQLTWINADRFDIAAFSRRGSVVRLTLQDGIQYFFDGTLSFQPSVGATDGGLDTGVEQASTWYYLYLIPTATGRLVIRGSVNPPATGPSGLSNYVYIGAVRNDSGSDLLQIFHSKYTFIYEEMQTIQDASGIASEGSFSSVDISSVVPQTAVVAHVEARIMTAGSQANDCRIASITGSATLLRAQANSNDGTADNSDICSWPIALFTAQTIFRQNVIVLGGGTIRRTIQHALGWVDGSLKT